MLTMQLCSLGSFETRPKMMKLRLETHCTKAVDLLGCIYMIERKEITSFKGIRETKLTCRYWKQLGRTWVHVEWYTHKETDIGNLNCNINLFSIKQGKKNISAFLYITVNTDF